MLVNTGIPNNVMHYVTMKIQVYLGAINSSRHLHERTKLTLLSYPHHSPQWRSVIFIKWRRIYEFNVSSFFTFFESVRQVLTPLPRMFCTRV